MAILIEKQQKKNPQKPDEVGRWYLYSKSMGTVTEKEVAKQIVDETTLNPKEAEMALEQLRKIVLRNLQNGYTVRLGDWAYFYTTVHSDPSDEPKEATAAKITQVKMHLGYEKAFQAELDKSTFVQMDSLKKKDEVCEAPKE